jgi:hypothetical protein
MQDHVRTEQIDGYRVDKATGEVYGQFQDKNGISPDHPDARDVKGSGSRSASFAAWVEQRRNDLTLEQDFKAVQNRTIESGEEAAPVVEPVKRNPKGAGRKPKVYINPVAHLMVYLVERKEEWFDNIVWGSCHTSGGVSAGKMNVKVGDVLSALYLKEISASACTGRDDSARKGRLIAQAARHAAHGIAMYLIGQPELLAQVEAEAEIEARLAYMGIDMPVEIPVLVQEWYAEQPKPTIDEIIERINQDFEGKPEVQPYQPYTFQQWREANGVA